MKIPSALVPLAALALAAFASPLAAAENPADAAFTQAMDGMMMGMHDTPPTGNVDADFARMMLPHHQAAVDMAKAEIQYGTDPELKQLAASVVAAQDQEIGLMKAWLAKHPK